MTSSRSAISMASAATVLGWSTGWSFSAVWLNAFWILLLAAGWGYEAWGSNWPRFVKWACIVIASITMLYMVKLLVRKAKFERQLPQGYVVRGDLYITGFMDAGTVFRVCQRSSWLPFFEKNSGVAFNLQEDYLSTKGNLEIELTPTSLVVKMAGRPQSDTLFIQQNAPD